MRKKPDLSGMDPAALEAFRSGGSHEQEEGSGSGSGSGSAKAVAKSAAPATKSKARQEEAEPVRLPRTIKLRDDYHERLRDQAHKEKTTMSALIEKALGQMWGDQ